MLPTDTVYGLVCSAQYSDAVARLYRLKSREQKPGTIIAASAAQVRAWGIAPADLVRAERFWPGVSVVLPVGTPFVYLHQGLGSLAIRVVEPGPLADVLVSTGPLLTSSANHPGMPPATTLAEARAYFGDDVDFYVDGGDLSGRQSSTLVRFVGADVEILRQGSVQVNAVGRRV